MRQHLVVTAKPVLFLKQYARHPMDYESEEEGESDYLQMRQHLVVTAKPGGGMTN